jgi:hypothetical protein
MENGRRCPQPIKASGKTGEKAMDKQTQKTADAGKVRIGGYSPPGVKPASVQDTKKVRTGGMSPSF